MSRGVGRVRDRREINVETVGGRLDNEETLSVRVSISCPASSCVSSDAMPRHNHGPDAGQACLPMTHQLSGMRERLVCGQRRTLGEPWAP